MSATKFLTILCILSLFSCKKEDKDKTFRISHLKPNREYVTTDTIKVIAKIISQGEGSKIQIAEYKIIKTIKGTVTNDTIKVGYYFYKDYENVPETALLTLMKYTGNTKIKDYYIFPDYDAKKGINTVNFGTIPFGKDENSKKTIK